MPSVSAGPCPPPPPGQTLGGGWGGAASAMHPAALFAADHGRAAGAAGAGVGAATRPEVEVGLAAAFAGGGDGAAARQAGGPAGLAMAARCGCDMAAVLTNVRGGRYTFLGGEATTMGRGTRQSSEVT